MTVVPADVALDDLQRPWPRRPRPHAAGLDEVLQLERKGAEMVRKTRRRRAGQAAASLILTLRDDGSRRWNLSKMVWLKAALNALFSCLSGNGAKLTCQCLRRNRFKVKVCVNGCN